MLYLCLTVLYYQNKILRGISLNTEKTEAHSFGDFCLSEWSLINCFCPLYYHDSIQEKTIAQTTQIIGRIQKRK